MNSFPTFDANVGIMRSIMSVPVGPRRIVALFYRFGHRPFECIDLGPSIIHRLVKQHKFKLGSKSLKIDEHVL